MILAGRMRGQKWAKKLEQEGYIVQVEGLANWARKSTPAEAREKALEYIFFFCDLIGLAECWSSWRRILGASKGC